MLGTMMRKTLLLSALQLAATSVAGARTGAARFRSLYSSALQGTRPTRLRGSIHAGQALALRGGGMGHSFLGERSKFARPEQQIEELFKEFDKDASGTLTHKEVRPLIEACFHCFEEDYTITEADFEILTDFFDVDNDGKISLDEVRQSFREWFPDHAGKKALIIVDLQNDFITGSLPVPGGDAVVAAVNSLRQHFKFDVVAHTRDWHPVDHVSFNDNHGAEVFSMKSVPTPSGDMIDQVMWPRHCVANTPGADFHPDLVVADTDLMVNKGVDSRIDSYSGFFDNGKGAETQLRSLLREREVSEVFVTGVALDFCVGSTALDAVSCGLRSNLVLDCTRGVGEETKEAMMKRLAEAGVEVVTSEQIIKGRISTVYTRTGAIERAKKLVERRKLEAPPEMAVVKEVMQQWNTGEDASK